MYPQDFNDKIINGGNEKAAKEILEEAGKKPAFIPDEEDFVEETENSDKAKNDVQNLSSFSSETSDTSEVSGSFLSENSADVSAEEKENTSKSDGTPESEKVQSTNDDVIPEIEEVFSSEDSESETSSEPSAKKDVPYEAFTASEKFTEEYDKIAEGITFSEEEFAEETRKIPATETDGGGAEEEEPETDGDEEIPEEDEEELHVEDDDEKKSGGFLGGLFEIIEMVAISVCIVIFLITFLVRYSRVDGSSMTYTIEDNDCVLVQIIGYKPGRGDIVVLQAPDYAYERPLIKRVIAVGGDELSINFRTWEVKINGEKVDEYYVRYNPYGDESANRDYLANHPDYYMNADRTIANIPGGNLDVDEMIFTLTVPKGKVFVMGDNRNNSHDSRAANVGLVDERYIVGRATVRILPFDKFGTLN